MLIRILSRTLAAALLLASITAYSEEPVDLTIVHRIKAEAFGNSKVMDHLFYLTDVHGPRLAGSPGYQEAGDWVVKRLKEYGLTNVHQEPWAFGRGWDYTYFSGHIIEPRYQPLIGFPLAWTPGTGGAVQGEAIYAPMTTDADLEKFKGKLKGKIVLTMRPKEIAMVMQPMAHRLTDEELQTRTLVQDPSRLANPFGPANAARQQTPEERERAAKFRNRMNQFLHDEGALVVLQYGYNGDGGTVFASSGGSRETKDAVPPPMVAVTPEHYNRIVRLLQHEIPVKLEFDIRARIIDTPTNSFNVVGEIEGSGPHKDEVVMLGAHLDSWHGGTGATDNGTGSSVAIEAVRILKSLNVKLDRTVRVAFWGGEEEGLLGSQAYVKEHFADRETMQPKPEYSKLSAYFNDDTGTGRFRGISAMANDEVKPIFEAWLKPFHDLGATVVTGATGLPNRRPGGTDHTSFDYVGLPGFGFMQDPMEYGTRTHHSNMDVYDRVQPGDMMQASAIMASFVYNAATRPQMIPRTPMPKAIPKKAPDATN